MTLIRGSGPLRASLAKIHVDGQNARVSFLDNSSRSATALRGAIVGGAAVATAYVTLVAVTVTYVRNHPDETLDDTSTAILLRCALFGIPAAWLLTQLTARLLRLPRPLVIASAGLAFALLTFVTLGFALAMLARGGSVFTTEPRNTLAVAIGRQVLLPVSMLIVYARVAVHVVCGPYDPALDD